MGGVKGRVQFRRCLEVVLFTVSRLPPAACWRLQTAPGDYTRQMLRLLATLPHEYSNMSC